jgi:hypothetical protein
VGGDSHPLGPEPLSGGTGMNSARIPWFIAENEKSCVCSAKKLGVRPLF